MQETAESGYTKRAVTLKLLNLECLVGGQFALHALYAKQLAASFNRAFKTFRAACSFAVGEAALIMARFYMSPPADPGGPAKRDGVGIGTTGPDSTFSLLLPDILVNGPKVSCRMLKHPRDLLRRIFSGRRQAPLAGTPAVRRLKTYSAQSGYVY